MPAPWKPNLQRSPTCFTPEVPKSWSSITLPDEVILSQMQDSATDVVGRFLAGLAPGDPGYEQAEPERFSQTHFLHRSGSFDADEGRQGGATSSSPANAAPTSQGINLQPPADTCEDMPCTQLYNDSAYPSTQLSVEEAARVSTQRSSEEAEKVPTQLSSAEADRASMQDCEHMACTQLYDGSPLPSIQPFVEEAGRVSMQRSLEEAAGESTQCSVEVAERVSTQLCEDMPGTQLYDGSVPPSPQPSVEEADRVSTQNSTERLSGDMPCTQLYDDSVHQSPKPSVEKAGRESTRCSLEEADHVPMALVTSPTLGAERADTVETSGAPAKDLLVESPELPDGDRAVSSGNSGELAVDVAAELDASTVTPVRPTGRCKRKSADDSAAKRRMVTVQPSGSQVSTATTLGHTLAPPQQGLRVAVVGDGWGSQEGGYEGIVTEADLYTFTVIATSGTNLWKESHVLKQHCIFLAEESATAGKAKPPSKSKRRCRS